MVRFERVAAMTRSTALGGLIVMGLPAGLVLALGEGTNRPVAEPSLVLQVGHPSGVNGVFFSPDGRFALTSGVEGPAKLWDFSTGVLIRTFEDPGHFIYAPRVAFSPDSRSVLSYTGRRCRVWDTATGVAKTIPIKEDASVSAAVFSADGRSLLIGLDRGGARLINIETGETSIKLVGWPEVLEVLNSVMNRLRSILGDASILDVLVRRLDERGGRISTIATSADGQTAITGAEDGSIRVWDARLGMQVRSMGGRSKTAISSISTTPDNGRLVAGDAGGSVTLWDLASGRRLRSFVGHSNRVLATAFSRDGRHLWTGSSDGSLRRWDVGTGAQVAVIDFSKSIDRSRGGYVTSVAISPDRRHALTSYYPGSSAQIWELDSGKVTRGLEGAVQEVSAVEYSPDGRRILVRSGDGVRLWDLASGRVTQEYLGNMRYLHPIAFSPGGDQFLCGVSTGVVLVRDSNTGQVRRFLGGGADVAVAVFSPDGQQLLMGSRDGTVRLRDLRKQATRTIVEKNSAEVVALAFSCDGRRLMVGAGRTARVFDASTLQMIFTIEAGSGLVPTFALSPDGRRVATGSDGEREALIWDVETRQILSHLQGHEAGVITARFSQDGRRLLTGSRDATARLWNAETGRPVQTYAGHLGCVLAVALSPDGRSVLTGSEDGTARLWDAETGKETCRLFGLGEGNWAVADPSGRFDSDRLESIRAMNWVFPDDPLRPLPAEIFMRDYYEPRLLARLLDKESLKPVRPLSGLNRVQPVLRIAEGKPGVPQVIVEVSGAESRFGREGRVMRTEAYDVRLFRDGQLVGRWPEPTDGDDALPEPDPTCEADMAVWRAANLARTDGDRAKPGPDGGLRVTFPVRLPGRQGAKVEFTAYAFNEDRVKSAAASAMYEVPRGVPAARPRAYLVAFGAAGFSDPDWDLSFAAADARLAAGELGSALEAAKQYEVVPVVLATDRGAAGAAPRPGESVATAAHLKAVLGRLAGRPVDAAALAAIPGADRLAAATPDDLVILFASSHGYTDRKGAYYLFPSDLGPPRGLGRAVTPELLEACVSSGELSAWLRGVDAGQLAMVVDCCHAAATVESPGFKPGPMGSRGLGQLAYDKAMRVLAASQADDVALEARVKGEGHGLLTYALVKEGLQEGKAAGAGGALTLGGLLKYAEGRVPGLYAEVLKAAEGGKGATAGGSRVLVGSRGSEPEPLVGDGAPEGSSLRKKGAFQTPTLFNYARGRDIILGGKQ